MTGRIIRVSVAEPRKHLPFNNNTELFLSLFNQPKNAQGLVVVLDLILKSLIVHGGAMDLYQTSRVPMSHRDVATVHQEKIGLPQACLKGSTIGDRYLAHVKVPAKWMHRSDEFPDFRHPKMPVRLIEKKHGLKAVNSKPRQLQVPTTLDLRRSRVDRIWDLQKILKQPKSRATGGADVRGPHQATLHVRYLSMLYAHNA